MRVFDDREPDAGLAADMAITLAIFIALCMAGIVLFFSDRSPAPEVPPAPRLHSMSVSENR